MAARTPPTRRAVRRTDALTRDRIVRAATTILDAGGEGALTFRALADRLATGPGAIYHHVADKDDLLAAATDDLVGPVMAGVDRASRPAATVRAIALGLFDTIDAHPWVGTQLTRTGQAATLAVFEAVGQQLQALGVPERALFDGASAVMSYVLGVAGQNAANARTAAAAATADPDGTAGDRHATLGHAAARWAALDPAEFPFLRTIAAQLADHDDRAQFLAGLDLLLTGIAAQADARPASHGDDRGGSARRDHR